MGRNRVLSFMSQFSAGSKAPTPSSSPPSDSPLSNARADARDKTYTNHQRVPSSSRPLTPPSHLDYGSPLNASPNGSPPRHKRSSSRPLSLVQTYQPPVMDVNEDTIPELQPIFSFLNSSQNKLYHEGYFLKLDDQDSQGRPNADRTWTECFAQLVGTVLSLWDAAELDAAGEDGEVLPKFLNLTDASLKMIESLPTRSSDEQPLQNILSISTAGRNRYLLHFNSHHALVQWTAGIRLAIYEHNTLQEAYTGALVAGKGKTLNNINVIMERCRIPTAEWVRVRFGAGVPWRRCWCIISPPDEKEYAKLQKELKKRSAYDRSHIPILKGDIKFYDAKVEGKKQKKAQPIATITDAYSAYAIYPQAKSLVDASTLLKVEGSVTIHSEPPSSAEGFVFIMPETRPMVSGFEMLLRFLFPTWDTFGLYGRPGKLVASILDPRSLMFAMPKHKRYGYLEPLDVTTLINDDGSTTWNEQEWRKRLKEATGSRMNAIDDGTRSPHSRSNSRTSVKISFGQDTGRPKVGFTDDSPTRSARSQSVTAPNHPAAGMQNRQHPPMPGAPFGHARNTSDPNMRRASPHIHSGPYDSPQKGQAALRGMLQDRVAAGSTPGSDDGRSNSPPQFGAMRNLNTPEPVSRPPEFGHSSQQRPVSMAYHSPEMRRANSRLSSTTLAQLAKAGGLNVSDDSNAGNAPGRGANEDKAMPGPSVHPQYANSMGTSANDNRSHEALRPPGQNRPPPNMPPPLNIPNQRSGSPAGRSPYGPPSPYSQGPNSPRPQTAEGRRSPYPPGGPGQGGPPRSPYPQNRLPHGGPTSGPPGGPPPHGGRGRPPPNMRPHHSNGTPPHDYYGRGRGGPGPRPYGGPPGPGQRKPMPERTTGLDKHGSVTADAIIEHYANDHGRHDWHPSPPQSERRLDEDRGYGGNPYYDEPGYDDAPYRPQQVERPRDPERPRAGTLKTIGSGAGDVPAPVQPYKPEFDIPDVNFGPTFNYGAGPAGPAGPPQNRGPTPTGPGAPYGQRPYSPASMRPGPPNGRNSPAPQQRVQQGQGGVRRPSDPARTVAWTPGNATAAPGQLGPGPGGQGGPYGSGRPGVSPGPSVAASSFSRPLQSQSPSQVDSRYMPPGHYPGQAPQAPQQRNVHPPYQGQAF